MKFDPLNASASVTVAAYARKGGLEERRQLVADAANDEARPGHRHPSADRRPYASEEVRPRHPVEMIRALRTAGKLAPKSIYNIYSTLKALFRDAKIADLLIGDLPTILTRYQLGDMADKDPEWRATARYSREELEILISDPRSPLDRRVFYALGRRPRACGSARWRAYASATTIRRSAARLLAHRHLVRHGVHQDQAAAVACRPIRRSRRSWPSGKLSGWPAMMVGGSRHPTI